jgi:hypothetical protein
MHSFVAYWMRQSFTVSINIQQVLRLSHVMFVFYVAVHGCLCQPKWAFTKSTSASLQILPPFIQTSYCWRHVERVAVSTSVVVGRERSHILMSYRYLDTKFIVINLLNEAAAVVPHA